MQREPPPLGSAFWLAVVFGTRPVGVQQLEEAWEEWSLSTRIPLSTDLILAGRDEEATRLLRWLTDDPSAFRPAVPVRDLIEITRSQDLERGIFIGIHNSRGVTLAR